MLELGEHLLGRTGATGRKEQRVGACVLDRCARRFGLVAAEVAHDGDVAAAGRRNQLRFDVDSEGVAVGRSVQDSKGVGSVTPQSGNECRGVQWLKGPPTRASFAPWPPKPCLDAY